MIQITDKAAGQIRKTLENAGKPDAVLRVGVKGGGCSGLTYTLNFDEVSKEGDSVVESSDIKLLGCLAWSKISKALSIDMMSSEGECIISRALFKLEISSDISELLRSSRKLCLILKRMSPNLIILSFS